MKSAETCSSLCNKLYTYLYHHIVVLDKYIHSNLVAQLSNVMKIRPVRAELFHAEKLKGGQT